MKKKFKLFWYAFLIIAIYAAWGVRFIDQEATRDFFEKKLGLSQPCEKPLTFSVGKVDPRFNLTEAEVIALSQEAASLWNEAAKKEVLRYAIDSEFKINLIFDDRQQATLEAQNLEADLKKIENVYDSLSNEYKSLSATYQKKVDDYKKSLKKYKKELEEYSEEVEKWNEKGGAPEDVFRGLEDKKEELDDTLEKLEKQRKEINTLVKKSNNLADQENKIARNYNQNLSTYQGKFGDTREFEKGVFVGTQIDVYQFREKSDLKLTFIHEFGHYLGIPHVQDPKSIMYYLIGDQDLENPVLTAEDLDALRSVCPNDSSS